MYWWAGMYISIHIHAPNNILAGYIPSFQDFLLYIYIYIYPSSLLSQGILEVLKLTRAPIVLGDSIWFSLNLRRVGVRRDSLSPSSTAEAVARGLGLNKPDKGFLLTCFISKFISNCFYLFLGLWAWSECFERMFPAFPRLSLPFRELPWDYKMGLSQNPVGLTFLLVPSCSISHHFSL